MFGKKLAFVIIERWLLVCYYIEKSSLSIPSQYNSYRFFEFLICARHICMLHIEKISSNSPNGSLRWVTDHLHFTDEMTKC